MNGIKHYKDVNCSWRKKGARDEGDQRGNAQKRPSKRGLWTL